MRQPERLSTVVITRNEEDNIERCLNSVASVSDEIVVVDSGSTDRTVERARKYTQKVIRHDFEGYVQQKNVAVDSAEHNWILSLDADECLSDELSAGIARAKQQGFPADAYEMNRLTFYLTGWFKRGGWYPDSRIRLFDRRKAKWAGENPHDYVETARGARVERLEGDIQHHTYRDLSHHLSQIQHFSSIAATEKGRGRVGLVRLRLVFDPPFKFLKTYLLKGAWLEGTRGLVFSVMAAFAVFLKYAKLWELHRRGKQG